VKVSLLSPRLDNKEFTLILGCWAGASFSSRSSLLGSLDGNDSVKSVGGFVIGFVSSCCLGSESSIV